MIATPHDHTSYRRLTPRVAMLAGICTVLTTLTVPARAQTTENPDLRRAIAAYDAGDLQRALVLLQTVPELPNTHDSAVQALYTGLVYFALGDRARATDAFATAVRTEPPIRLDPTVHSPGRIEAFEEARSGVIAEWRVTALGEEGSDAAESQRLWRMILAASPGDEEATAHLAAIEEAQRQRAEAASRARADSMQRTLAQPPRDTANRSVAQQRYDPGRAFALGLVVPGLGQMYTGRGIIGALALATAGGAVAAGYLSERVSVDCRTEPVNNVCPPEDVLSEDKERPYLSAGIAAAAGIALLGAIDALLAARRANARADESAGSLPLPAGVRLVTPALVSNGTQFRAEILRLRFR